MRTRDSDIALLGRRWTTLVGVVVAAASISQLACSRLPTTPNDNTWRFLPGHVESLTLSAFRGGRQCWVYLPPGYATSGRRYPVLYLNDGHAAFNGGANINRICEDLIRRGEISPLIVVAVSVQDRERFFDYTPWPQPASSNYGGGDSYVRAIRDTLKPEIDRRYKTLTDPTHTAMAGFSLGGLISAYAGYAYDSTFGMVGAFSPSYWWFYGEMHRFATNRGRPPQLTRFYQVTGSPDDNDISEMEQILVSQGFEMGVDLISMRIEGGEHVGGAVERRFPDMLRFLFEP